jgi:hypothetical protein
MTLPLSGHRLPFPSGHFLRKGIESFLFDIRHTSRPVGTKQEPKYFSHQVIEFTTVHDLGHLGTVGTGGVLVVPAAHPDFTPGGLFIFLTAGTLFFQVSAAGTAVKAAKSHQVFINGYDPHKKLLGQVNSSQ